MRADKPLSERQRIGSEDQREVRAAFLRRHVQVLDEQHAIEAAQIAIDVRGLAFRAIAERWRD